MGRRSKSESASNMLQKAYNLVVVLTGPEKRMFLNFKERLSKKGDQEPTAFKYLELYKHLDTFQKSKKKLNTLSRYILSKLEIEQSSKVIEFADHLYKRILESLRQSDSNDISRLSKANGFLQDIHFLYGRNLYVECLDQIKKAEAIAKLLHNYPMLLELNGWKWKVYTALQMITDDYHEKFIQIATRNEQLLRWMHQTNTYCATSKNLFFHFAQQKPLSPSMESDIKLQLFEASPNPAESESPLVQYWYYMARTYWIIIHQSNPATTALKSSEGNILEFYEGLLHQFERENGLLKDEESMLYMLAVDNYLNYCIRNDLKDLVEQLQDKISKSKDTLSYLRSVMFAKISHALGQYEFDSAHELILKDDYLDKVEKIRAKIPETRLVAIWFTCGQIFFILSDLEKAQSLFKKITEEVRPQVRPDLAITSHLLLSILYFEIKSGGNNHFEMLDNLRKSLVRKNQTQDIYKNLISLLNYAFKNIPRNKNKRVEDAEAKKIIDKMNQMRVEFKAGGNRIEAKLIFAWMEARINRSSIQDELRK